MGRQVFFCFSLLYFHSKRREYHEEQSQCTGTIPWHEIQKATFYTLLPWWYVWVSSHALIHRKQIMSLRSVETISRKETVLLSHSIYIYQEGGGTLSCLVDYIWQGEGILETFRLFLHPFCVIKAARIPQKCDRRLWREDQFIFAMLLHSCLFIFYQLLVI